MSGRPHTADYSKTHGSFCNDDPVLLDILFSFYNTNYDGVYFPPSHSLAELRTKSRVLVIQGERDIGKSAIAKRVLYALKNRHELFQETAIFTIQASTLPGT